MVSNSLGGEHLMKKLREKDHQVAEAIDYELQRQRQHIELIASENFVSLAILDAMGTVAIERVK